LDHFLALERRSMQLLLLFVLAFACSCMGFVDLRPKYLLRSSFERCLKMVATKEINMPALSSTMKEGKIVSWNKKVGDKVSAGEVLLVVESDKADMDVESFEDGYLAAINTPEGGVAPVGAVVAVLVESAADIGKVGTSGAPTLTQATTTAAPASSSVPSNPAGPKPDFEQIMMPALSSTMKEGKVVSWSKKLGDKISSGDMVLVVESDKADMDVESYEEGFLAAILVGDGQTAPVGAPVGVLAKSKEEIAAVQAYVASGGASGSSDHSSVSVSAPSTSQTESIRVPAASPAATVVNTGRVAASGYAQSVAKSQGVDLRTVTPSRSDSYITSKDLASAASSGASVHVPAPGVINATPMARKLATENNLDVTKIAGTGNFNRVTADDVLRAAGKLVPTKAPVAAPAAPSSEQKSTTQSTTASSTQEKVLDGVVSMSAMQKAVAKNMEKTLSVPVFRVARDIVTDKFDALYLQLKPKGVTVSAMLAKAVAIACQKNPIMNAAYVEGGIKYNKDVNVAMAVALDGGLMTPTIKKAQDLDLFSISRAWKELVDKTKSKKLTPDEYSSGTITISNLGMYGVSSFDAILPYGMGAILAISASQPRVVQMPNGYFGVQKAMTVTVTSDHRHIYGADVAQFLKDLADILENDVQQLTMG